MANEGILSFLKNYAKNERSEIHNLSIFNIQLSFIRVAPLKERFALRALRLRSVPSELEGFFDSSAALFK
jgi:hypothetical protein